MKKIYTLIGAIAFTSVMFAQGLAKKQYEKYTGPYSFQKKTAQNKKTAANINVWVSPAEGILTTKSIATTDYGYFLAPVLVDSTLIYSPAQTNGADKADCALGYVLDPLSAFVGGTGTPIFASPTAYTIDSLFIPGSYRRVAGSTTTDTLYTYLTYATTSPSNTATRLMLSYAQLWVAPISTWSGTLAAMRVTNNGGPGVPLAPVAAAAGVSVRVKTLLTASSPTTGVDVALPIPLNVPAGNVVAAYYTFAPGGTHTNGEVNFSFTGGATQTQNGFCGIIAQQTASVGVAADVLDMFNCPDGTSHTLGWDKKQRYNQGTNNTLVLHQLLADVIMQFKVNALTVGVNELKEKGFFLGQNTPNPFNGSSTINFELEKDASSALFTVTDVMGRIVSTEKVATTPGTHTINISAFAAGIYYYSLNVDGNVTTKKMIVE